MLVEEVADPFDLDGEFGAVFFFDPPLYLLRNLPKMPITQATFYIQTHLEIRYSLKLKRNQKSLLVMQN